MKLINAREESDYVFDVQELSADEEKVLLSIGLERIKDDHNELINYAVRCLLNDYIDSKLKDEKIIGLITKIADNLAYNCEEECCDDNCCCNGKCNCGEKI